MQNQELKQEARKLDNARQEARRDLDSKDQELETVRYLLYFLPVNVAEC